MIDARRVECAGAANDAVDLVAFFQQQIGQVTSVLASYAGDERLSLAASRFNKLPLAHCESWRDRCCPVLDLGRHGGRPSIIRIDVGMPALPLRCDQFADAFPTEREHFVELPLRKCRFFARSRISTNSPSSVATRLKSTVRALSSS